MSLTCSARPLQLSDPLLTRSKDAWDEWAPRQDLQSVKVMETVLDAEPQTDLVVLNGDLITGENTFLENSTHYIDQLVQPMLRRNLTWASTYGNHDSDLNISTTDILAREHRYPNSRTTSMVSHPDAGVSNYYLPVYPAVCRRNNPCRPILVLWFFDSRGGFARSSSPPITATPIPIPNWVYPHVAAWFRQAHARLNPNTHTPPIPSLAFFHIPTRASFTLQQAGLDPHRQPGLDDDGPLDHQAKGWCPDDDDDDDNNNNNNINGTKLTEKGCDYGGQDAPFMAALADTPGLLAVFSGHDHGETWCARWGGGGSGNDTAPTKKGGVVLCFGQHSGYGGYGSWIRGGRQVGVSVEGLREGEVETWVRLESGKVVGRVRLNATYGRDGYPETPDERTRLPPPTEGGA